MKNLIGMFFNKRQLLIFFKLLFYNFVVCLKSGLEKFLCCVINSTPNLEFTHGIHIHCLVNLGNTVTITEIHKKLSFFTLK